MSDIRLTTLVCRAALFPVWATPSSLQILFRSLLMSVLERSAMLVAMDCRLVAMLGVRACVCVYVCIYATVAK